MMRHEYIDRYARLDSPIHRLPAFVKFCIAIVLVFSTAIVPASFTLYFGAAGVFLFACAIASGIPLKFLLLRLLMLEPLVIGVAALALLQADGGRALLRIVLRSNICLATLVLLSNTTAFSDILHVLQKARVPSLFVTVLALMYRYVFLLIDQAERMTRARRSRTLAPNAISRWSLAATIVGQLFVRSTERAERIFDAMTARGWRG
ncbi:MAG TPA: energy-coupling factor transporter transmembrane component T [Bacteroidota bacterium]|nr:energy-coupling factor transporter transmembrane component T [Bacteroidota bacterium]